MARRRSRRRAAIDYKWLGAIILVTAVAALLILGLQPSSIRLATVHGGSGPVELLLDGRFGARFAGEMSAQRQGFFAANVAVKADAADRNFVDRVARARGIGVTSGQNFLLAAWRGVPVTAFAASQLDTPIVIFTLESSGLRRPADLVDKRIGLRKGGEGDIVVDAMMAQLGLPRSRIVKVPDQDNFDALRAGTVDAIISEVGREPAPSEPDYLPLNRIRPQDYAIHVPGLVYFASNELLRDHPSAVAGVLEGLIKGWRFVYSDLTLSVPVLASFDPKRLDPARLAFELAQQRDLVLPTGGRIADYDESRWRTLRDILLFAKLGEETVPLAQAVNYQLLRDAYRRSPDLASPGSFSGQPIDQTRATARPRPSTHGTLRLVGAE